MPKIRKSTSLKFAAVAIGVAGIVGLTISSASSLNLAGGTVQAGATTAASCQTSQAKVTFGTTFAPSTTTPGYNVTSVTINSVDALCVGQQIKVTLTDSSGNTLGEISSGTTGATAGANTLNVPTGTVIPAAAVTGTSVVIYN
ncbi:MAG: hypothetical protein QOE16_868 [Microbacteriaceae bacterium]|jgi:hypothetical protein|nr:hypothetical protein [Microbacteriaceae bacterium]